LMETLADFGTVSIFNFDTFTTAIYKSWFALFNLPAASQLASLLVLLVVLLLAMERWARGDRRYHGRIVAAERIVLSRTQGWCASLACGAVLAISFVIPMLQLVRWTTQVWQEDFDARYLGFIVRSIGISLLAGMLVTGLALLIVLIQRRYPSKITSVLVRFATVGYAVPGTVLAVGVFIPIAWIDNQLLPLAQALGWDTLQILKGSVAVMLLALAARFMAVGFQPLDGAMQRISYNQEDAARTLGVSERGLLRRLHIPLMRGGVMTAVLMVFVDVMKEMPITLMTRPFGWDTLAVRVFEMTSEGMWQKAALPSMLIVLAGILPVIMLVKKSENKS
jgi:iron(III) transport system permease protein